MTMLASQITSLAVVYSIVYSGIDQRKHQSSASLAFVQEIHRGPVNFPHKWPVTRKMFPFDDVIMLVIAYIYPIVLRNKKLQGVPIYLDYTRKSTWKWWNCLSFSFICGPGVWLRQVPFMGGKHKFNCDAVHQATPLLRQLLTAIKTAILAFWWAVFTIHSPCRPTGSNTSLCQL